ncbi:nucleotidyltransferase family protein [Streptomyces pimonensis]|uniref:nucleotidyltransferase family protein n=1 Tax=Streptomyces pimonensis TaxID=2860288 RepID=UPI003527CDD0
MIGRLPLDEQLAALKVVLSRNEVLLEVLDRTAALRLPGWYLTAGCPFQTVGNVVTGRPPTEGIKDYDVFHFDDRDLSWEAEDAVIRAAAEAFADLPAEVEVRNEAPPSARPARAPTRHAPGGRGTGPNRRPAPCSPHTGPAPAKYATGRRSAASSTSSPSGTRGPRAYGNSTPP